MSAANEIQRLQTAKADIKLAIENKGVTVGDGTIDTYAELINQITGGSIKNYTEGTITFEDTNVTSLTVEHNLGVVPDIFLLLPDYEVDYTINAENAAIILKNDTLQSFILNTENKIFSCVFETRTTYGTYGAWFVVNVGGVTETIANVPIRSATYDYRAGMPYKWIAAKLDGQSSDGGGGENHYDTFWDSYQNNGNRTDYGSAFEGVGWNDITFNPKYPITISGTSSQYGSSTFSRANMTEIKVDIILDIGTWLLAFDQNRSIVTVKKIILMRNNIDFDRTFQYATNLTNIMFEGIISKSIGFPHSSQLSDKSVQNIIDCLADLTGGTAQTLTVHKTVYEKIIANGWDALITAKNWILVSA